MHEKLPSMQRLNGENITVFVDTTNLPCLPQTLNRLFHSATTDILYIEDKETVASANVLVIELCPLLLKRLHVIVYLLSSRLAQ